MLAAYEDDNLNVEAAEQLVCMAADASVLSAKGEDLPKVEKESLLRNMPMPVALRSEEISGMDAEKLFLMKQTDRKGKRIPLG